MKGFRRTHFGIKVKVCDFLDTKKGFYLGLDLKLKDFILKKFGAELGMDLKFGVFFLGIRLSFLFNLTKEMH